jgi:hypothetical protein
MHNLNPRHWPASREDDTNVVERAIRPIANSCACLACLFPFGRTAASVMSRRSGHPVFARRCGIPTTRGGKWHMSILAGAHRAGSAPDLAEAPLDGVLDLVDRRRSQGTGHTGDGAGVQGAGQR